MGAVRAHVNVVGVEADKEQYLASRAHLEKLRDSFEAAAKTRAEKEERAALDAQSRETTTPELALGGSSSSNDPSVSVNNPNGASTNSKPPKCPACSKPVKGEEDHYVPVLQGLRNEYSHARRLSECARRRYGF